MRRFLKWVCLTFLALGVYSTFIEPFRLKVVSYDVRSAHWSGPPIRIAVLSDIHATKLWMTPDHVARIVTRTNALKPDLVLITGDFVATHPFARRVPAGDLAAALGRLSAPCGVFAVWGNHDWQERDADDLAPPFAQVKINMLENQSFKLRCGGRDIMIAGLADQWWRKPNISGALDGTEILPTILMMHQPDLYPDVPQRVALTIAGHTHGGQVRVPFYGALIVPSKFGTTYQQGHYSESGRHMVVSPGLGMSGLPIRFNAVPEITYVTLEPFRF